VLGLKKLDLLLVQEHSLLVRELKTINLLIVETLCRESIKVEFSALPRSRNNNRLSTMRETKHNA
jgi:hypothetical protein